MPAVIDLGTVRWDWSRPYILGVLNVTPDSFSDGGRYADTDLAVAHGERLLAQGADALDVGGESTRPNAPVVTVDEELRRVIPVIRALAHRGAVVSVDTTKADVAAAALEAGARIVNDVSMGDEPEALGPVAARAGAAYITMHARGTPRTMRQHAQYDDVVAEVGKELSDRVARLRRAGVDGARIVIDPGIGFANQADQSLSLLAGVASLRSLGYAVCVGPSRKSFIDAPSAYAPHWSVTSVEPHERLGGTLAAVALVVDAGAEIVRVHDVALARQAARIAHAVRIRRLALFKARETR